MDTLTYLLISWGTVTSVLVILIIYRAILSGKEDDQIYLNKAEVEMMESEQRTIIARQTRMKRSIIILWVLSGILLLATATAWLWAGLRDF